MRWAAWMRLGSLGRPANLRRPPLWVLFQCILRVVCSVLFDARTWGLEKVPRRGAVLLVCNHQSYLDPILLTYRLRRRVSYFAKSELFRNPVFGRMLRALGAFPVRIGAGDRDAMRQAISHLEAGELLQVFPEGTRSADGALSPIQGGVALMVQRAHATVIPAVVDGAFDAWPMHAPMFRAHPVRMLYGDPLMVAGLNRKQIAELIERTFRELLAELRRRSAPWDRP